MAFMSFIKKGISATELQRQLDHSRYQTIWSLMHRISEAIGKRDDLYRLDRIIEFVEAYFEKSIKHNDQESLKQGRGIYGRQMLL